LQALNLDLETPTPEIINQELEVNVFYSHFKDLTADSQAAQQISWREVALVTPPRDQIAIQTRASYDGKTWTDWAGNTTEVLWTDYSLTQEGLKINSLPQDQWDRLKLRYHDRNQLFSPTSLIGQGIDQPAAFANLTFNLTDLNNLQLGEELVISETIADQTYQIQGVISDLKMSENLISVFAWHGVIPEQGTTICSGANYCFSTQATVHKIQEEFVAVPELDVTLDLPLTTPADLIAVALLKITAPDCLEPADDPDLGCRTAALSLTHYQQEKSPLLLQYRWLKGLVGDLTVSEVFLIQGASLTTPSVLTPANQATSPNQSRLRGGKTFTTAQASYWR
jgi:hypothetical protein